MTGIPDIDVAGIQLLIVLIRESAAKKKDLNITGTVSEAIQNKIILAGCWDKPCATGEELKIVLKAFA
ncbi:hypothetical protein K7I13_10330 [Brucepastera parasyntrophica]|uniref:hypothetical protein n=1 Tax=Brucepastera parasyntrophica TaxID=2880008 RepID=UPI00210F07A8|nr:hypothetical protein [Brucepastera parasyntrophica]ULQ58919.1 hypothetical protein K7I13_10330 [Brucepastera parasyntrophica]